MYQISVMIDSIHYSFLAVVYVMIAIFWGIFGRVDLPIWSALTALVCVVNGLLLAVPALKRKNKELQKNKNGQKGLQQHTKES